MAKRKIIVGNIDLDHIGSKLHKRKLFAAEEATIIPIKLVSDDTCLDEQPDRNPEINNTGKDLTMDLTDELILRIFTLLNKRTLMTISQACTRWNKIVKDKTLWKVFSLSPCKFELTEEGFRTLAKTRLCFTEKLHLCNARVSFTMLRSIYHHCKHLKTLLFGRNCHMEERRGKRVIVFSKHVQTLDMRLASGSFVFLCTVKEKNALHNIQHLGVGPRSFDRSNLLLFLNLVPNLRYVDFTNCLDIADDALVHLAEKCPQIESLCLIGCRNIIGNCFSHLIKTCKNLKTLLLRYLKINDQILIGQYWEGNVLEEIDISACPFITAQGLYSFLGKLKQLKYLNMSYCGEGNAVTDGVLYEMANSGLADKLKMLDIRWSFHIRPNALRAVLRRSKHLENLGIYQSFQIMAEDVVDLIEFLPRLKILEFGSSTPQELNCGLLVGKMIANIKDIEILSLINFVASNSPDDFDHLRTLFLESRSLKRINFCDCSSQLVKIGRSAERQVAIETNLHRLKRKGVDITTKWECALPPPTNTLDAIISK